MATKIPGSREEDIWLTEGEVAEYERADEASAFSMPAFAQLSQFEITELSSRPKYRQ